MDKSAFFKAAGLRSTSYEFEGHTLTLNELSAGNREVLFEKCSGKGSHYIAALTVALSCTDFNTDDVDTLMDSVRPEVLMEMSELVYKISGVTEESADEAKKD